MLFVTLAKFRRKPTKADLAETDKLFAAQAKAGVKTIGIYWTFGRYDSVRIFEAPDEKTALKGLTKAPDFVMTETMLAIPRSEAEKLLE
jgi:uncharacterized protein with GYD domain